MLFRSCHICLTANTQKKIITAEIYFNDNKELFESLRKKQIEIEQEICVKAKWIEARKNCRLIITHDADIKQGEDAWPAQIDWLCNMTVLFELQHMPVQVLLFLLIMFVQSH